jgi:hypothetical protein
MSVLSVTVYCNECLGALGPLTQHYHTHNTIHITWQHSILAYLWLKLNNVVGSCTAAASDKFFKNCEIMEKWNKAF